MAGHLYQSDAAVVPAAARPARIGPWIPVGAAVALVCVVTLFPFNFIDTGLPLAGRVRTVDSIATLKRYPPDIAGNLLLFVPLGAAIALLLKRWRVWFALIAAALASFALATGVETLQMYLPRRDPSVRDVLCNTISGAGGVAVVAASAWFPGFIGAAKAVLKGLGEPAVLAALLIIYLILFAVASRRLCGEPSLANWDGAHFLLLGNETCGQRPWNGVVSDLWFCNRTLDSTQWTSIKADARAIPAEAIVHYDLRQAPYTDRRQLLPPLLWRGAASEVPGIGQGVALGPQRWLQSEFPAEKLAAAIRESGQFTVGLTVQPAGDLPQVPGRIASVSMDVLNANLTLGQEGTCLVVRLRSTLTGRGGVRPELFVPGVFADSRPRRVVLTGDASRLRLWANEPDREWSMQFPGEMGLFSRLLYPGHWAVRMSEWNGRLSRWGYQVLLWGPVGLVLLLVWWRMRSRAGRAS